MEIKKPFIIDFSKIGQSEIGFISVAEKEKLPFKPKRIYWTYYTPENVERGSHAHIDLEQILIAVSGKIKLNIETHTAEKFEFILDSPNKGIYIPKKSWRTMKYSHHAVQVCIASEVYNKEDYINDYNMFLKMTS
jgi:hypothetical protein